MNVPSHTIHVLRSDARGGLELSTLHVVRYLQSQSMGRHSVLFLSPLADGVSGRLRELGIPVESVPYPRRRPLAFLRALAARMRDLAPELVVVHGCFGLHAAVALAARLGGARRVFTFIVNRPPRSGLARIAQQAMAHAARPLSTGEIAISAFLREVLVREYGLPRDRVHVNYRWRELDRIAVDARRIRPPSAGPVLGTVGRLDWMKDHATLIRALPELRRVLPDARLVIVGDGDDRVRLRALADALGVADAVHLAGHRDDVPAALADMDLFLFATSEYEGFGNVLVEAMAAGVPIVCTDIGPCREVLGDGVAGVLVPPRDPVALAAAAADLWRDPARRMRLAAAALRWAHARYTVEVNGPPLARLLYPGTPSDPPRAEARCLATRT